MRNRHGILAALLAILVLLGNALLLPRLLDRAQALPEGQVVTQQPAASNEQRIPLPTPPPGMDGYEVVFSRPLDSEEQQLWDALSQQLLADPLMDGDEPLAGIFVTQRARELALTVEELADPNPYEGSVADTLRLGDGAPGTVLLDPGTATVCLGNEKLTRETALPLIRAVVKDYFSDEAACEGMYESIYRGFAWMQPQPFSWVTTSPAARHWMTRGFTDQELSRRVALEGEYLLNGLRAGSPLPVAQTADDALWYDEAKNTLHLPERDQMTDDELLHYIDLDASLSRQQLLEGAPEAITEQQAVAQAKEWAMRLFGWDVSGMYIFPELAEGHCVADGTLVTWLVSFGPADMRTRGELMDYDYCEIRLSAQSGRLVEANRNTQWDVPAATGKTIKQLKAELEPLALEVLHRMRGDDTAPAKLSFRTLGEEAPLSNKAKEVPQSILCLFAMPEGDEYTVQFATGNAALINCFYWGSGYNENNN